MGAAGVVDALSHLMSQCDTFDYSTACNARRRLPARALVLTGHGSACAELRCASQYGNRLCHTITI
jgi:hypothetical protein